MLKGQGVISFPIAILSLAVLTSVIVVGVSNQFVGHGEELYEDQQEDIDDITGTAELSEYNWEAEEQVAGLTWFTMLRAEHCGSILGYILQEDIQEIAQEEDDPVDYLEGEFDNPVYLSTLESLQYIDNDEIRDLRCEMDETVIHFGETMELAEAISERNLQYMAAIVAEEYQCKAMDVAAGAAIGVAGGAAAGAAIGAVGGPIGAAAGAAAGGVIGAAAGYFGGDDTVCDIIEDSTFWEETDAGDMEGRFGNLFFRYPGDSLLVIDNDQEIKTGEIQPQPSGDSSDWYWQDYEMYFAPDPRVAHYSLTGEEITNVNQILECDSYPYAPYVPYMLEVPMIVEEEITASDGSSTDFWGLTYYSSTHNECGNADTMDWWEDHEDDILGQHDFEKDYYFVLCPGSTGRVQANKGMPTNAETSTEHHFGDQHHYLYPFVEKTTGSEECLEEHIPSEGSGFSTTPISHQYSGEEPSLLCNPHRLGNEESEIMTDNEGIDTEVTIKCGLEPRHIGGYTYYILTEYWRAE